MRALVLASTLILLTACQEKLAEAPAAADQAALAPARPARGAAAEAAAAAADASAPARPLVSIPMLAYRYAYILQAPANSIRDLVSEHERACQAAGPAVCQVVGAQVVEMGEDRLRGQLILRATPDWVKRFRDGLEGQAKGAGGRVVSAVVDSEDLSRQIIDTEAALRARTTLRDRLQALLASRPGKLAELLEVEQELARVQGEIDATQSTLAVMRTRVATSEVKIAYDSTGVLAPQGVFSPVAEAVADVSGIFAQTLAFAIRFLAVVGPWALLVGAVAWLLRKQMKRKPKAA